MLICFQSVRLSDDLQIPLFISPVKHVPSWVPGATFQRLASEWLNSVTTMVNLPWDEVMQKYVHIHKLLWSLFLDFRTREMGHLLRAILVR